MNFRIALSASLALFLGVAVLTAAALTPAARRQLRPQACDHLAAGHAQSRDARRAADAGQRDGAQFVVCLSRTPLLPAGITEPQITIVGDGKVNGSATVDLDAVARPSAAGRSSIRGTCSAAAYR